MKSHSRVPDSALRHLAILAAVEYEAALVRRCIRVRERQATAAGAVWHGVANHRPIVLLRCGIGAERARQATTWLAQTFSLQGLVNVGFAGGLQSDVHTGDAVLAQYIQSYAGPSADCPAPFTEPITPTPSLLQVADQAAVSPTGAVHRGALLSANSVVATSCQKHSLASVSSALAVDMEAYSIAQVAMRFGLPFVSLKTVFDTCDDDISLPLMQCTAPTGTFKPARLLTAILLHPGLLTQLPRLWHKAKIARQQLQNWLSRFLSLMSRAIE